MLSSISPIRLYYKESNKENPRTTKLQTYEYVREYAEKFKQECGSIYCRDLKSTKDGKQIVSCATCVETAARLVEEFLETQK